MVPLADFVSRGIATTDEDSHESRAGEGLRYARKGRAPTPHFDDVLKTPFAWEILEQELPRHFRQPQVGEYTGSSDPEDHLCCFENASLLYQYTNEVKCRVFLNTLSGSTQQWFNRLYISSI